MNFLSQIGGLMLRLKFGQPFQNAREFAGSVVGVCI